MRRRIEGFHQDEVGDWVAELSCLHGQHVRHRPPFHERPWVETEPGRLARLGTTLECPLCDRGELPARLVVRRSLGPFDAGSLPAGLRRDHRLPARTWGLLRVQRGRVRLAIEAGPPEAGTGAAQVIELFAGDERAIPPEVAHRVTFDDAAMTLDVLESPSASD